MLEKFDDISTVLGAGVYVLLSAGEVVFVGRASRTMLAKIAAHRAADRPSWFPIANIRFDRILIRNVHPDQLDSTYYELIEEYSPKYNLTPRAIPTATLERRL